MDNPTSPQPLAPLPFSYRQPLYEQLWASPMFETWHWWQWNFAQLRERGFETPFAQLVLDALVRCDTVMPGFAADMLGRVVTFGGREKHLDDYEQCRQWLGELLIIHHLVTWPWPQPPGFEHEPELTKGGRNPELIVRLTSAAVGVEVKTPDLRAHGAARGKHPWQLNTRTDDVLVEHLKSQGVTWPRDNPLKDYCTSADMKFGGWRESEENFFSVLFIIWDDYINEPIAALTSPAAGLFTENSFHRTDDDQRQIYPNLDVVVLLRHQHQFREGMANRQPLEQRFHCLDYGSLERFPPHARIDCPDGRQPLPEEVLVALQAVPPHPAMGAEYAGGEMVMWIGPESDDP